MSRFSGFYRFRGFMTVCEQMYTTWRNYVILYFVIYPTKYNCHI